MAVEGESERRSLHGNNPSGQLLLGRRPYLHDDDNKHHHDDDDGGTGGMERNVLTLNVLLLGDPQNGRSSVGNALIGGEGFHTGHINHLIHVKKKKEEDLQILKRNFRSFFRRNGAESDLELRVIDTPPLPPAAKPRPPHVHAPLCPAGVHVIVLVMRVDQVDRDTHMEEYVESLFGAEWPSHSILVLTHADFLEEAGLNPSSFLLTRASDWLRELAGRVGGGAYFMDNTRDWPTVRGEPLREKLLSLSAKNHHTTLPIQCESV